MQDKDRVKRISVIVNNYTFTCEQVAAFTKLCINQGIDVVVMMFAQISDKDNFETVLKVFTFAEEKAEVLEKTGWKK